MNRYNEITGSISGPIVLDGAMGTMLMRRGLQQGTPPETWNMEHDDIVGEIHEAYFSSGSRVVHTNSFGGTRLRLADFGLDHKVEEYNVKAVEIAHRVNPGGCLVAGDMGPTGKLLKPLGPCEYEEWFENFSEQAHYLASAGVDFLSIETMYDKKESLAAVRAAKSTNLPVWVSMTFRKTPKGYFTLMGDPALNCLLELKDEGVDSVGVNCTLTSTEIIDLVLEITELDIQSVHVKPNAGNPRIKDGELVYDLPPHEFARDIHTIVQHGIRAVGGCCGTTPEYIKAICKELDNHETGME